MSKKKDSPALYELISKGKTKGGTDMFAIPAWMADKVKMPVGRQPDAPVIAKSEKSESKPSPPPPRVETPKPVAPKPVAPRPAAPVQAAPRPQVARPVLDRPVAKQGERLLLSLSLWHGIVAGVVMVLVLVGVFLLGRAAWRSATGKRTTAAGTGQPTPTPPVASFGGREDHAAAPPAPPAPRRAADSARPPAPDAAAAAATAGEPVREKGKYYLIIQGTRGLTPQHLRDAQEILAFLAGKGEKATLNKYTGNPQQYIVLSLTGFDSPDGDDAKGYAKTVEALGRRYMDQGGKYNFSQGDKGWFVKW